MTQISALNVKQSKPLPAHDGLVKKDTIDQLFQRVTLHDDASAFETIFHATYKALCQIAVKTIKNNVLAEEIVDDVFCHFWKNRKTITITTSFRPYLLISVRNRSLDYLRRMKSTEHSALEPVIGNLESDQPIALNDLIYEELQARIDKVIQSLPAQCRTIFLMNRNEGFTYREIAEKLGLSIKTIETQMGRALKHLRTEMSDWL